MNLKLILIIMMMANMNRWADWNSESDEDSLESGELSSEALDEDEQSITSDLVDDYGTTIDDLFLKNWGDKWMVMPMNSPITMVKGCMKDGSFFYEMDILCRMKEDIRDILDTTMAKLEIHYLNGSVANFAVEDKKTYISKMEIANTNSVDRFHNDLFNVCMSKTKRIPNTISYSSALTKHIEAKVSSINEFMVVKTNFVPNKMELMELKSCKMIPMVPGSKIMWDSELPELLMFDNTNKDTDDRLKIKITPTKNIDKLNPTIRFMQYSFFDRIKSNMKLIDSISVDPDSLKNLFKKVASKRVDVSTSDYQSISDAISNKSEVELTREWVAKYTKVRSSIMENSMAAFLDIGVPMDDGQIGPWSGEIEISSIYPELIGMKMLTPDLIVSPKTCRNLKTTIAVIKALTESEVEENDINFVEIKVSDRGSKLNVGEAQSKYSAFCSAINKRMEEIGSATRAKAFVVEFVLADRSSMVDLMNKCKMASSRVNISLNLIESHWSEKLKDNRVYRNLKHANDRNEDHEFDVSALDAFFGAYELKNPDFMMTKNFTREFVELNDCEIGSEIMSFSMDQDQCEEKLNTYINGIFNSMMSDANPDYKEVVDRLSEAEDLTNLVTKREVELTNRVDDSTIETPLSEKRAFKSPFLSETKFNVDLSDIGDLLNSSSNRLSRDGTLVVHKSVISKMKLMDEFWYPNKKQSQEDYAKLKMGYSYSKSIAEELEADMKEICQTKSNSENLSKMVDETFETMTWNDQFKRAIKDFCMTAQFENMMNLQKVMQELIQIESRRGAYLKQFMHSFSTKKHCVFRTIGPYIVEVKNGSKLKRNSNLRFRIWTSSYNDTVVKSNQFHQFYKVPGSNMHATKYLSLQPIDLITYMNIFESAMMLTVGFAEKFLESTPGAIPTSEDLVSLSTRLFQLLEHRNNTSVASQLSRYLLVGGTSLHADRVALVSEIGSDVIRSKFQMFTIYRQLKWTVEMSKLRNTFLQDAMVAQSEGDNLNDRMKLPSFYCNSQFSISMLLDEIYFCNLLDPNYGTRKHMTEATFKKMAKMEILWRGKVTNPENIKAMRGLVSSEVWATSKDTTFFFDRALIYATMHHLLTEVSMVQVMREYLPKIFEPLTELMTLKSSVMETHGETIYDSASSLIEVRSTAFETQKRIMDDYSATTVLDVANMFPMFDYYFAEFPKPQIGGPREILIQDAYTRAKARMLENFFNVLNRQFDNEMTSNSQKKFTRQANMDFALKESMKDKIRKKVSMNLANNKDHSKWSPGANVIQYTYMVTPMDIGLRLKVFIVSAIMAYASAKVGMPIHMLETLSSMSLPKIMETKEKEVAWMYSEFMKPDSGQASVIIKSGWPQGMLQFASSTYHVVGKHAMRLVWTRLAQRLSVNWTMFDMITSDDTTDYMMVEADSMELLLTFVAQMLASGYTIGKGFNMQENKKKTNLQMVIKEFNSIFQVGKAVKTAILKYLVKSVAIPDFTYPEEAVKELISQEQMLLMNGASLNMIKACRACHRRMLRAGYNQESYEKELADLLECSIDDLPVELGFLPKHNVLESCIFGASVFNYTYKSKGVVNFINKTYSKTKENMNFFSVDKTSYMSDMMFKEKLKLPMRLDKKMAQMKERIGATETKSNHIAEQRFDVMMEGAKSVFCKTYALYKMMSINVRFSIDTGFLYRTHSMVRANQINSTNSLLSFSSGKPVSTILDFVKMVLSNRTDMGDVVSNHPMASLMRTSIEICKEVEDKVRTGRVMVSTVPKMPKFREVMFCNKELYPVMSTLDSYRIFRTELSKRNKRDSYKANILDKYYSLTEEFTDRGLSKALMASGRLNAMTMSSIFENMSSMMKNYSFTMPFEEVASSNAAKNVQKLMRNRLYSDKTIADFELDAASNLDLLMMTEMYDNVSSIGLLTQNISMVPFLAEALRNNKMLKDVAIERTDKTNLERMILLMNHMAKLKSSDITLEDCTTLFGKTVLFDKTSAPAGIFSDLSATVKSWISERFNMITVVTRDTYNVTIWDAGNSTDLIANILAKESKFFAGKIATSYGVQMVVKEEEFGFLTINISDTPLFDISTKLTLDFKSIRGCWSMVTKDMPMLVFGSELGARFKIFTSKIPSEFPLLSDESISAIPDSVVASKLRAVKTSESNLADLSRSDIRTISTLWMTKEEMESIQEVYEGMTEAEKLAESMFQMDNFSLDVRTVTSLFSVSEFTNLAEGPEEVPEELVEDMMTVFDTAQTNSVFTALMNTLVTTATEKSNEDNTEFNMETIKKMTIEALVTKVRRYMVTDLSVPISLARAITHRKLQTVMRRGKPADTSKVAYDLLMSLKSYMEPDLGVNNSLEVFTLCAKVFLSSIFDKDATFNIKAHSGSPFISF